jgi:hypothetical protein
LATGDGNENLNAGGVKDSVYYNFGDIDMYSGDIDLYAGENQYSGDIDMYSG